MVSIFTISHICLNFDVNRRQPLDQILGRSMEDLKASPQGSGSPGTPSANDRAAAKRAELRRQEQERRRREAVRSYFKIF